MQRRGAESYFKGMSSVPLKQAKSLRVYAERARRLAVGLTEADSQRLLMHAEALERQAVELEQQLAKLK